MITQSTLEILDQGLAVLENLSDENYNTKLPIVYGASIGGHYRHVLEHFSTLFESHAEGFVNYDHRKRDTRIETCRKSAIEATHKLKTKWAELDPSLYDQPLEIQGKLSPSLDQSMQLQTSVGREVAYSIAHAQHHYAIIGVMCTLLQSPLTEGFGVAPSTAAHLKAKGEQPLTSQ